MTDPQVAILMLGLFIFIIMLGFPIAFTLMAMGIGFGYYAYFDASRMWRPYNRAVESGADTWTLFETWISGFFNNRIFDLFVNQTYSVMSNDVLTAIPLFLFMGYVIERANIVDRLFHDAVDRSAAAARLDGGRGAHHLRPVCDRHRHCRRRGHADGPAGVPGHAEGRYDERFASGVICAGGTLGILIPPSIMLIVYAASSGTSIVRLYAGALIPGFMLAGLYLVYIIVRATMNPSLAPKPDRSEIRRRLHARPAGLDAADLVLPLAILILAVLGAILFGLATPSEAAAVGAARRLGAGLRLSRDDMEAPAGIGLSVGAHHGDGVLAVCRLVDVRLGVFLSRRRACRARLRHSAST
jgi:TRAP-type mannitol/chloroaromatic compound transport system permease large subunit